jgi:hypothetical protein
MIAELRFKTTEVRSKTMGSIHRLAAVAVAGLSLACAQAPSASAQAPGSFYRQSDRPEVMYQYTSNLYCHVQNETQMAAYGGFGKVKVVPRMQMAGRQTGDCGWPNGFYRRSNEPAVYRLSGRGIVPGIGPDICHVVNEQQMAAFGGFGLVKVVQPNSDLGRGRNPVTPCRNP